MASIRRQTIPKYFVMTDGVLTLAAGVTGVALYSIDFAVLYLLYLLYNSDMICSSVLSYAVLVPIKEDNHTRQRLYIWLHP